MVNFASICGTILEKVCVLECLAAECIATHPSMEAATEDKSSIDIATVRGARADHHLGVQPSGGANEPEQLSGGDEDEEEQLSGRSGVVKEQRSGDDEEEKLSGQLSGRSGVMQEQQSGNLVVTRSSYLAVTWRREALDREGAIW